MSKTKTATCSFMVDRDIYDAYKRVVSINGETVKESLIRYMTSVSDYKTPNAGTIEAIEEVQRLKANPTKESFGSFADLLEAMGNE